MRKTALLAVLIATVMVVPIAAYAIHSFTDVPDGAFFHNSVTWMKDNGITVGCNPPTNTKYCPNDDVTRGEMAVLMKRLSENKVVDAATAVNADNATNATNATNADNADKLDAKDGSYYTNPVVNVLNHSVSLTLDTVTELGELSISTPAGGGLFLQAQISPNSTATAQATYWLQVNNGTCTFDSANFYSVDWGRIEQTGNWGTSSSLTGVAVVSAGTHTVTLCARVFADGPMDIDSSVVAIYSTDVTSSGTLVSVGGAEGEGLPTG